MTNKEKIAFRVCDTCESKDRTIPIYIETKNSSKKYVSFGEDNQYPNHIYDMINDCSTLGSAINTYVTYVVGGGINGDVTINKEGDTLVELLEKVVYDYIAYGAASIQLLRNTEGKIVNMYHIPVHYCRLDEASESVYYNKKWNSYNKDTKKYPRWNATEIYANSIFYIKSNKSIGIYGTPLWASSMRDVSTLIEASKQNLNSIINNFASNVLINFANGIPDDDTKDAMEEAILEKYTGSKGSKIFISWSDSQETAPSLQAFSSEDYTEKYSNAIKVARENILGSFGLSPQLIGILPDQTGFNSVEYTNAYSLFKDTTVKPIQKYIEKQFSKLNIPFTFNEFKVEFVSGSESVKI